MLQPHGNIKPNSLEANGDRRERPPLHIQCYFTPKDTGNPVLNKKIEDAKLPRPIKIESKRLGRIIAGESSLDDDARNTVNQILDGKEDPNKLKTDPEFRDTVKKEEEKLKGLFE